jgi:hypothetical protein
LVKRKGINTVLLILSIYGIICCSFLAFYDLIPKTKTKYFQSAYTFFEYSVFASIFWFNIHEKKVKRLIAALSVGFFLFCFIYLLTSHTKRRLDSIPIGIETILILLFIIYFLYEFSKRLTDLYIYNHYGFWISVGILIYLGGSFFFNILVNHMDRKQLELFYNLALGTEILKNILFSLGIILFGKKSYENLTNKKTTVPYLDMI